MALRNKKNELAAEKHLFERKGKRAKHGESRKLDYQSSDYAGSTPSSRCDTPVSGILSPPSHTSSFVSPLSPSPGPRYSARPSQIHAKTPFTTAQALIISNLQSVYHSQSLLESQSLCSGMLFSVS